jgi:hypothetical protein
MLDQMTAAYRATPKPARDCHDCGRPDTMKLQNGLGIQPKNIPLLYICYACGTTLKIPASSGPIPGV